MLPVFDGVRVVVRVRFNVQIKYSNAMIFKNLLSASWPVRELSSPRLDWPRVSLSVSCPVSEASWVPLTVTCHLTIKDDAAKSLAVAVQLGLVVLVPNNSSELFSALAIYGVLIKVFSSFFVGLEDVSHTFIPPPGIGQLVTKIRYLYKYNGNQTVKYR